MLLTIDAWVAIAVAGVPLIFGAGGYFALTGNHLAHMAKDIKNLVKGQKRQDHRIDRIEATMMAWTGQTPKSKGKEK